MIANSSNLNNQIVRDRQRRLLPFYPRIRLSTLMLLFVASAVFSLWYSVRQQRLQALRRLIHMEMASGYPRIRNLDTIEASQCRRVINQQNLVVREWSVWVPYGETAILHYATQGLVVARPEANRSISLEHGRHIVELWVEHGVATLSVDGVVLDFYVPSPSWNVSVPFKSQLLSTKTTETGAIDLVESYGVARLSAGETYDPNKHRFGLCIWVSNASDS